MSQQSISISFPDGNRKEYPSGITGREIAASISKGLAHEALSITLNGEIRELDRPIEEDGTITINKWESDEGKYTFWHSSAHVLAEAIQDLYPEAKFGIGPPIEQGFYYDVDFRETDFSEDDLKALEEKMLEKARKKSKFKRQPVSKGDALAYYQKRDNPYKLDLIEGLQDGNITFYTQGDFTDLCKGPHIPDTGKIKAVKLTHLAGAYWRGDENSEQLTRIYGISFPKQKMLKQHLHRVEEAKKRDHKKLGKQLDIYKIDSMVGRGLPIWLPNGAIIRRELETFLHEEQKKRGYQEVITPHIAKLELYETSGHHPYYKDSQFNPIEVDDERYMLKPMNCPHHHRIYDNKLHSYRDLPIRLAEFGSVYRYEQSGELNGLARVRGFTQDDAHIYCMHSQLKDEIKNVIDLTQLVFGMFDMPVDIRLSFRDETSDKFGGNPEYWEQAEKEITEVASEVDLDYEIARGEASFYGPKIDFVIRDAIGRKWQLGTIQVDYVMPERFDLNYIGSDNQQHRPVVIHRAPFGSFERFVGILIEHFAGDFPLWLAPTQITIIPISDAHNDYAFECAKRLKKEDIRVNVDHRSEQIGAKIKKAETSKVPYMFIVGDDEISNDTVSVRRHKEGDIGTFDFDQFVLDIKTEIEEKQNPQHSNS
jgi:threonyl-tRNA synthetase